MDMLFMGGCIGLKPAIGKSYVFCANGVFINKDDPLCIIQTFNWLISAIGKPNQVFHFIQHNPPNLTY
jgi:hypothetical protein